MKLVTLLIAFSLFNAFCTKSTEEKSGSGQNEKKEVRLNQFENSVTSQDNGNFADLKTTEFDQNRKEKRDIGIKDLSSKKKKKKEQKKGRGAIEIRKKVQNNDKRVMPKRKGPETSKGSRQINNVNGRKRKTSQNSNSKKSKKKKQGRKVQKRQGPKEQRSKQKLERIKTRKKIRKRNLRKNKS